MAILNALRARPTTGLLAAGLLVILAASFATVEFPWGSFTSRGSQRLLLIVGGALCVPELVVSALGATRRQKVLRPLRTPYQLPPEASDVDFLFTMFYNAMPPAFVKRVDNYDGPDSDFVANDIFFSEAFDHIQEAVTDANSNYMEELDVLAAAYREGDRTVLKHGKSRQLELPPTVGWRRLPILTMKTRFEHKGKCYIAGWYLPVDVGDVQLRPAIWLREAYRLPYLRLTESTDDTSGVQVHVSEALLSGRVESPDDLRESHVAVAVDEVTEADADDTGGSSPPL